MVSLAWMEIAIILLFVMPQGVLLIVGGLMMRQMKLYPLALIAGIVALLPCSPLLLFSLPVGLWALIVLLRQDVKEAFDRPRGRSGGGGSRPTGETAPPAKPGRRPSADEQSEQHEAARRRLVAPAIGLIVGQVLNGGICLPMLISVLFSPGVRDEDAVPIVLGLIAVGLLTFTVIAAAVSMLMVVARRFAIAGVVLAMIPMSPGWLISLPMAIWALVTLTRRDVKQAFVEADSWAHSRKATAVGEDSREAELEAAQHVLVGPMIAMIVGAFVNAVPLTMLLVGLTADAREDEWIWPVLGLSLALAYVAYVIAAALTMRACASYRFAMSGVLLLLPIPLALPFSIWALVVLTRPEVKHAFGRRAPAGAGAMPGDGGNSWTTSLAGASEGAVARIAGAATWMMVGGLLNGGSLAIFAVAMMLNQPGDARVLLSIVFAASLFYVSLMVWTSIAMRTLGSYRLAAAGGALSLVPAGPGWLVSLVTGLRGLAVLRDPEVHEAFAWSRRQRAAEGRRSRGFVAAAVFVMLVALSAGAGATVYHAAAFFGREAIGTVLAYRVERIDRQIDPATVSRVVEQRLDFDGWPRGEVIGVVSEKDGFRLSVGVYGDDPKRIAQIEERLAYQGRLEFRLLADRDRDAHIAAASSDEQNDVRIDNRIVGWWVPAAAPQRKSLEETLRETGVSRTSAGGEFEVLVLNGAHDISGEHVVNAARGWDMNRFPMLSLQFNSFGAQQMSALSRAAIERAEGPRTDAGEREDFGAGATHLGVIFDGRLVSAPRIRGELGGYVQVSGDFTESQIDTFVSVLRGGVLPARLVLLERRKP